MPTLIAFRLPLLIFRNILPLWKKSYNFDLYFICFVYSLFKIVFVKGLNIDNQ
jgi:hypothetical protein